MTADGLEEVASPVNTLVQKKSHVFFTCANQSTFTPSWRDMGAAMEFNGKNGCGVTESKTLGVVSLTQTSEISEVDANFHP